MIIRNATIRGKAKAAPSVGGANPLRIDPSRTATLRRQFISLIRQRFAKLKLKIVNLIIKEDALGLKTASHDPLGADLAHPSLATTNVANTRWKFQSNPEKVRAFKSWLRVQIDTELLGSDERALWEAYIRDGYKRGAGRAFDDVKKPAKRLAALPTPSPSKIAGSTPTAGTGRIADVVGGTTIAGTTGIGGASGITSRAGTPLSMHEASKDDFIRATFTQPVSIERVQVLAGRSFDDLEGVTDQMSTAIVRSLADGLVTGASPDTIARSMVDTVDGIGRTRAETIARTEIIRAHAEGQLDAMEQLGVEEVGVAVEWTTAGPPYYDDLTPKERRTTPHVCRQCQPMEGVVLKLSEAKGMIPRHPNCRCAFVPANVGEEDEGQKDSKKAIDRSIRQSLRAGSEDDSWGIGIEIGRNRPRSTLNRRLYASSTTRNQRLSGKDLLQWLLGTNAFCPTGEGGGIDATCSPSGGGSGTLTEQGASNRDELARSIMKGTDANWSDPRNVSTKDRREMKQDVVNTLSDRLVQHEGLSQADARTYVKEAVDTWADTSGDSSKSALSMQVAAAEEFGMADLPGHFQDKLDEMKEAGEEIPLGADVDKTREAEVSILRQMYNSTQDHLASLGLKPDDTIRLYRGMSFEDERAMSGLSVRTDRIGQKEQGDDSNYQDAKVHLQPMSSFTFHRPTAAGFAEDQKYGMIVQTEVKVKDILSTPKTGFGCLSEGEVVVLSRGVSKVKALGYRNYQ